MTILRRRKSPRMGIRKERREYPTHRQWVSGFCCSVPGCPNKSTAAHYDGEVPYADAGGTALKRHDKWCFPLCDEHHVLGPKNYHQIGHEAFDSLHGISTKRIAENMARASPHRFKWLEEEE